MAESKQDQAHICASEALESGSTGIKFSVSRGAMAHPAFAVRFEGQVYAYLNRCAHLMLQLDYGNGEFFDADGEYFVCANHGAMFEPATGLCINGPCYGASLIPLAVQERDGKVMLTDEQFELADSDQ